MLRGVPDLPDPRPGAHVSAVEFERPTVGQVVTFRHSIEGHTAGVVSHVDREGRWAVDLDSGRRRIYFADEVIGRYLVLPRARTWQDEFIEVMADAEREARRGRLFVAPVDGWYEVSG